MTAAARSTPWPTPRHPSQSGIPVIRYDDIGNDPTVRHADFAFGQWTQPLPPVAPVPPPPYANAFVKPIPRVPTPTPNPSAPASMMPTPLTAPPPSAGRALAIGFTIGTSLGLAILGAAWHFFL